MLIIAFRVILLVFIALIFTLMLGRSSRLFAFIPLALTLLFLGIGMYVFFGGGGNFFGSPETGSSPQQAEVAETQETMMAEEDNGPAVEALAVTVQKVGSGSTEILETTGTVSARNTVTVYPATQGEIASLNVQEGDKVKKGDVIAVLTGMNGQPHTAEKQYQLAQVAYTTALKSFTNSRAAADGAIRSAQLQLQSAHNQTAAAYTDLAAANPSLASAQQSTFLLNESLDATLEQSRQNIDRLEDQLFDAQDALDDLEDARRDTFFDFEQQMQNATTQEEIDALITARSTALAQIDAQIQQTESGLNGLEAQLDTASSGVTLSQNQILAQIIQAQNQQRALETSRQTLQQRQGLMGGVSDALLSAQQALSNIATAQNSALTQADSAVQSARLNMELAQIQKNNLVVVAPADGIVGDIDFIAGSVVSPQTAITEITSSSAMELTVEVSVSIAEKLQPGSKAEVPIGKQYVKTRVETVATSADSGTQLVTVTVALPAISLRPNQTLPVRLTLSQPQGSLMIPLDAVTIGTDEQLVYIVLSGTARKVSVELGEVSGGLVEIVKGLKRGMPVIVEGARLVVDGQSVVLKQ